MNNKATTGKAEPFFITTAIPYVNAAPHIGFALELVLTDAIARFQRLNGKDVWFLTGTDENSLKNVQAAEREGIPVRQLVDRNAKVFEALRPLLDLSFDQFIRTSVDEKHAEGVRRIWQACEKSGDLYKKNYKGLYCVGCEQFYTEAELDNGCCKEHLTRPEVIEEENYFFSLTRYQDQLLDLIESDKLEILPRSRKTEVLSFLRNGLADFSVSRSRARAHGWGLPVPGDEEQVIYVWFDALVNYISALGYAKDSPEFERFWKDCSERVHAIGKGITRFHAVYWPAILLSAGLPLPSKLYVHGYVTVGGAKIGKSLGNVIAPASLVDEYGCDSLRYFLLRDFPADRDSDFTAERLISRHNSDLVGKLGNLLNRTVTMVSRYSEGKIPVPGVASSQDEAFVAQCCALPELVTSAIADYQPNQALSDIFDVVAAANKYIQDCKPWELAKARSADGAGATDAEDRLRSVLYILCQSLHIVAYCIAPFLPATADGIAAQLGTGIESAGLAQFAKFGALPSGHPIVGGPLLFKKLVEPVAALDAVDD